MGTIGSWIIFLTLLVGSVSQIANTNKIGRVCTTWGRYHWKTFDGDFFQLASSCNHVLVFECKDSYKELNLQMRRTVIDDIPTISNIIMTLEGSVVELSNSSVIVDGKTVSLPHVTFGVSVMRTDFNIIVEAKQGIKVTWNLDDSLDIEIDEKYKNKICGLCGNFDGVPNDLMKNGTRLSVSDFADTHKVDGPTEHCEEPALTPVQSCDDKGQVCGMCGNYDGNSKNDFTTRSMEKVADVLQFANSWKVSSDCPNAKLVDDPCASNRYRAAWSQKQCSIIISVTFQSCHSKVDPGPYFDSCVRDSCACDSGGDCECLCTAVAAYAKACNEAGACVKWRTPKLCPVFCDYYNSPGECEWHYKPCGADCMKTCRNPSGNCSTLITALEGCYPQCPPAQPYFDEDTMKCVTWRQCGCYDDKGTHYSIGDKVPSTNCNTCCCNYITSKHDIGNHICRSIHITSNNIGDRYYIANKVYNYNFRSHS
ncbi:mucin-5AC-like [Notothenia coriiceps]|uniref:Mucin-5AC-like n=1 Tax=Notothenia coriiceps TaxID=8208 RepID=A0A6I9N365_9TELE|nr:PREDICTED: mucin-5AC-like [Notothenia coriiceps]